MSKPLKGISYSQAYIDNLVSEKMIEEFLPKPPRKTQASEHTRGQEVRVIIIENEAYWISEQTLYVATLIDGVIDNNTTKKVDTMTMDTVQLDKTQFIVQKLTEGK
jgi:hypothetical protein